MIRKPPINVKPLRTFGGFVGRSNNKRRVLTGGLMKRLFGASLTIALAAVFGTSALAAELPEVKLSASNKVPQCATPGRLMAYLQSRNPRLDRVSRASPRSTCATAKARHPLGHRLLPDDPGDRRACGSAATCGRRRTIRRARRLGRRGRGESFADVSTGVKAHLQHLLMYSGEHIDNPVADRTRKVQEWGVLTDWQKSIDGPMTYTLVAKQWAPTSRNYVRDVTTITDEFYSEFCNGDDPNPGLVPEARQGPAEETKAKAKKDEGRTEVAAVAEPTIEAQPAAAHGSRRAPRSPSAHRGRAQGRRQPLKALGAGMLGSIGQDRRGRARASSSRRRPAGDTAQRQTGSRASQQPRRRLKPKLRPPSRTPRPRRSRRRSRSPKPSRRRED